MPEGPIQPTPTPVSASSPTPPSGPAGTATAGTGSASPGAGVGGAAKAQETPKETVISIVIAFAMAFVFRGFVVEAFVIPTGSMAPTLLGQHMRFHERTTGNDWAVGPWQVSGRSMSDYLAVQENVRVHDPMSGAEQTAAKVNLRSGDRILVLKYLYAVMSPRRFDVVVFKDPHDTQQHAPGRPADNYIKRLIGLPNEQIALVDGDVFARTPGEGEVAADPMALWSLPGWKIARKPPVVQQAVWQPIFDSSLSPVPAPLSFQRPWRSSEQSWDFSGGRTYEWKIDPTAKGESKTTLAFDQTAVRFNSPAQRNSRWSITDGYPYNESPLSSKDPYQQKQFPVSDVRVRAGIEPVGDASTSADVLRVAAVVEVHLHEFRVEVDRSSAKLRVRKPSGEAGVMVWEDLAEAQVDAFELGKVTNVELWHADQSIRVYVNDRLAIGPVELDWSIAERFRFATGKRLEDVLQAQQPGARSNVLDNPLLYQHSAPRVRWELTHDGSKGSSAGTLTGARLHRVAVDRDLFYRPDSDSPFLGDRPGLATSPFAPVRLNGDQFFCCGDNSPQSLDGRLWGAPDPWVEREFGGDFGVVPRELMLGKAFFVYWPSLIKDRGPMPVPDFGRMRFIW